MIGFILPGSIPRLLFIVEMLETLWAMAFCSSHDVIYYQSHNEELHTAQDHLD